MLDELKEKKVLILGLGREGIDSFKFLRKIFPKKVLGVGDRLEIKNLKLKIKNLIKKDKKVKLHLGKDYLRALKDYDVIIKSPGVPAKILRKFRRASQVITSQTEIFFENCPGKIVGVTGTKGKSTTASLIYQILKTAGLKAHLIGNIGKPVLNLLFSATPNDIYVYELSSHQLFNLKPACPAYRTGRRQAGNRPHIAVLLNIYPEHLDYYKNLKEYANAKANITLHQKKDDYLIYNSQNKIVRQIVKKSKAKKNPISKKPYLQNIEAAKAVAKIFKISEKAVERAIKKFKPLPHRLELVGTFKGITFYNDALATIPEATIAALDTLGDGVETIFLGGFDRGISFRNLAKRILKSKIKNLILFPTTGEKIWREIISLKRLQPTHHPPAFGGPLNPFKAFLVQRAKRTSFSSSTSPCCSGAQYMKDAVKLTYQYTKKGKICLLSCASPSFSIFKDYKEKGNLFKRYVKRYGKNSP
ncbi:hypothetical protein GW765_02895 [Candidatus Parcubacteria bacterium]|nr:hypothetical protein [Candidatus Parcubacteria bacterium]